MRPFIESIRDIKSEQDVLLRRSYGMIEASKGKLVRVQLRPWPKIGSLFEAHWVQRMKSKRFEKDVCRLYYNQPMGHRNYLALTYVESSLNTSLKTFYKTLDVLSLIAYIKRSDAIIAEVTTEHLTDRFMHRRGWERFMKSSSRNHWIKRFYGEYPVKVLQFFEAKDLFGGSAESRREPELLVSATSKDNKPLVDSPRLQSR